ncbi:MAG: copper-binding protein [Aquabacterium sp.]|nr:copper-binding protein [Aquabacterium sp.]
MIKQILAISALALGVAMPASSFAQAAMDHGKMGMAQAAEMTSGEVKKVDQEAGKVTIKHGDIKHMDMPGMTMVFTAKDKALLASVKAGDKVKFMVVNDGGKMVLTDIQPTK